MAFDFEKALRRKIDQHTKLVERKNRRVKDGNGIFDRWENPVLTAAHAPLFWRYDLDPRRNPFLQERLGVNCVFNAGAIEWNGKVCLVARVEGHDRKSFFAVAESDNGVDNFRFWDHPVVMPETEVPDTNVYDMRLTAHEDGWIYGIFCTERKDPAGPPGDTSSAVAQAGIARTKDLVKWERLPDLKSQSAQQRNVVLHPELVKGRYALYTRPQDSFIEAGKGGGIGFALCETMEARGDRRGDDRRPEGLPHGEGGQERRGRPAAQDAQGVAPRRARRPQHRGRACATSSTRSSATSRTPRR